MSSLGCSQPVPRVVTAARAREACKMWAQRLQSTHSFGDERVPPTDFIRVQRALCKPAGWCQIAHNHFHEHNTQAEYVHADRVAVVRAHLHSTRRDHHHHHQQQPYGNNTNNSKAIEQCRHTSGARYAGDPMDDISRPSASTHFAVPTSLILNTGLERGRANTRTFAGFKSR
jgi:hypothetical protein